MAGLKKDVSTTYYKEKTMTIKFIKTFSGSSYNAEHPLCISIKREGDHYVVYNRNEKVTVHKDDVSEMRESRDDVDG